MPKRSYTYLVSYTVNGRRVAALEIEDSPSITAAIKSANGFFESVHPNADVVVTEFKLISTTPALQKA